MNNPIYPYNKNQHIFDFKVKVNFQNGNVSLTAPQIVTPPANFQRNNFIGKQKNQKEQNFQHSNNMMNCNYIPAAYQQISTNIPPRNINLYSISRQSHFNHPLNSQIRKLNNLKSYNNNSVSSQPIRHLISPQYPPVSDQNTQKIQLINSSYRQIKQPQLYQINNQFSLQQIECVICQKKINSNDFDQHLQLHKNRKYQIMKQNLKINKQKTLTKDYSSNGIMITQNSFNNNNISLSSYSNNNQNQNYNTQINKNKSISNDNNSSIHILDNSYRQLIRQNQSINKNNHNQSSMLGQIQNPMLLLKYQQQQQNSQSSFLDYSNSSEHPKFINDKNNIILKNNNKNMIIQPIQNNYHQTAEYFNNNSFGGGYTTSMTVGNPINMNNIIGLSNNPSNSSLSSAHQQQFLADNKNQSSANKINNSLTSNNSSNQAQYYESQPSGSDQFIGIGGGYYQHINHNNTHMNSYNNGHMNNVFLNNNVQAIQSRYLIRPLNLVNNNNQIHSMNNHTNHQQFQYQHLNQQNNNRNYIYPHHPSNYPNNVNRINAHNYQAQHIQRNGYFQNHKLSNYRPQYQNQELYLSQQQNYPLPPIMTSKGPQSYYNQKFFQFQQGQSISDIISNGSRVSITQFSDLEQFKNFDHRMGNNSSRAEKQREQIIKKKQYANPQIIHYKNQHFNNKESLNQPQKQKQGFFKKKKQHMISSTTSYYQRKFKHQLQEESSSQQQQINNNNCNYSKNQRLSYVDRMKQKRLSDSNINFSSKSLLTSTKNAKNQHQKQQQKRLSYSSKLSQSSQLSKTKLPVNYLARQEFISTSSKASKSTHKSTIKN